MGTRKSPKPATKAPVPDAAPAPKSPPPTLTPYEQCLASLDQERGRRRALGDRYDAQEEAAQAKATRRALLAKVTTAELGRLHNQAWRSDPAAYDAHEADDDARGVPIAERVPKYWFDIPQFPRSAYELDIEWRAVERTIQHWEETYGLNLEPDFQRAHVWTPMQQTAYIEYQLQGGEVGRNLVFNHTDWEQLRPERSTFEIIDGKQRLAAVRAFLRGEVPAFKRRFPEWSGHLRLVNGVFKFRVVSLPTRAEVLRMYLNINAGGTPHAPEEIARVRELLAAETRTP